MLVLFQYVFQAFSMMKTYVIQQHVHLFTFKTFHNFDKDGNLYVADPGNNRIRKITPAGKVITLAGDGTVGCVDATGTTARFNGPHGVAVDKNGNVYVADTFNCRIRKIVQE